MFWEGHKIKRILPFSIWRYYLLNINNVKLKREIPSNFVAFSENLNFTESKQGGLSISQIHKCRHSGM